uniref:Reverse transcriptase zinc-binding domain-containing protein n=1 Tax=Solanum lycopersicum TaxID=4081 RepID=A0A3Q7GJJ0_SOLLC
MVARLIWKPENLKMFPCCQPTTALTSLTLAIRIFSIHAVLFRPISLSNSSTWSHNILRVGNVTNVKFWKDIAGEYNSSYCLSQFFLISSNPDFTMSQNKTGSTWAPLFRGNLQDWELDNILNLLEANPRTSDRLTWGNKADSLYPVEAGYSTLCAQKEVVEGWPWKLNWKTKLPPKVICFTSIALNEASLTQDNINRKKNAHCQQCYKRKTMYRN